MSAMQFKLEEPGIHVLKVYLWQLFYVPDRLHYVLRRVENHGSTQLNIEFLDRDEAEQMMGRLNDELRVSAMRTVRQEIERRLPASTSDKAQSSF